MSKLPSPKTRAGILVLVKYTPDLKPDSVSLLKSRVYPSSFARYLPKLKLSLISFANMYPRFICPVVVE